MFMSDLEMVKITITALKIILKHAFNQLSLQNITGPKIDSEKHM